MIHRILYGILIISLGLAVYVVSYETHQQTIHIEWCMVANADCLYLFDSILTDTSTQCAFYQLTHPDIMHLLANRTIIIDRDTKRQSPYPYTDAPYTRGLMHHKFCVNTTHVLTGSANPTPAGLSTNDNAVILIHNTKLAKWYQEAYEALYEGKRIPPIHLEASDIKITAMICNNDCIAAIVWHIHQAQQTIQMLAFTFTHPAIEIALIDAHHRGIHVQGVVEYQSASKASRELMVYQGVDFLPDGNPSTMHHKSVIIDKKIVITGSMNPTKSADQRNAENLLIIESTQMAQAFSEEFKRVWKDAESAWR